METIAAYLFFVTTIIMGEPQNYGACNDKAIDSTYSIIRFDPRIHFMFDRNSKNANLSDQEIALVERLLEQSVDDYNLNLLTDTLLSKIKTPLDFSRYKRQLIAVTNEKGEREVFLNCICASVIPGLFKSGIDWRKEYFRVNDGGPCYFRVYLNLTTGTYYGFRVNGLA